MSIFSDRLNGIISARGYQQKKLAADLKLSPARLNNYIKGVSEPNFEILAALSSYLNVTADYLIGVSDSPLPVFATPIAPPVAIQIAEVSRGPLDDLFGSYYDEAISYLNYLRHKQDIETQSSNKEA